MTMKVKLDDVAKRLNISVAAVSMALNDKKGVSDETRERVLQVAREMGYKLKSSTKTAPDDAGQKRYIQLIRLKKHGLVAADTAFFAEVVEGIEEATKKAGYQLLIANHYINELQEEAFHSDEYDHADGAIIFATELESEDVAFLRNLNKKFVILDSYFVDHEWNTILMNNHGAAYQAIAHLKAKGHTQIGYLKSNTPIYNFQKRYHGYLDAMDIMGLEVEERFSILLEPTLAGAQRDMDRVLVKLTSSDLPTAFLADNDIIAVGAINAMKNKGIRIPEDVSIIGIDDMPFCQVIEPRLTTVRIFKKEMGREAVSLLLRILDQDGSYTQKIEINTELIERQSVKVIV